MSIRVSTTPPARPPARCRAGCAGRSGCRRWSRTSRSTVVPLGQHLAGCPRSGRSSCRVWAKVSKRRPTSWGSRLKVSPILGVNLRTRSSRSRNSVWTSVRLEQVVHVGGQLGQLGDLGLVLGVDGVQLLVDRVQLLVGALQLLVRGDQLLVGGLQLLVAGLHLLDGRLQALPGGPQLALQGMATRSLQQLVDGRALRRLGRRRAVGQRQVSPAGSSGSKATTQLSLGVPVASTGSTTTRTRGRRPSLTGRLDRHPARPALLLLRPLAGRPTTAYAQLALQQVQQVQAGRAVPRGIETRPRR